jgi:serine/threonine-protein kinase RsbW
VTQAASSEPVRTTAFGVRLLGERKVGSEIKDHCELKVSLPARSENLRRIRAAVAEFAESLGLTEDRVADLRLAVNEACSNVVRHAYEAEGQIEVEAKPVGDYLVVTVHDTGRGLGEASGDPGAGLGLRVASAVSEYMEIRGREDGTEVKLAFSLAA